jgi:NADH-quinone oxidoreductase subunit A
MMDAGQTDLTPYAAIAFTILFVAIVAASMLIVGHAIGPRRHGPVKDAPYESGMPAVGDARRRFNVRFYVVAMLFLLFDVEVVIMWPWAVLFHQAATAGVQLPFEGGVVGKEFLLAGMAIFFLLLVFGLVYEWLKGAFQWD